jgi:hypothetical protein
MFRYTDNVCKKCFLQNDPLHNVLVNKDGICSLCAKTADEPARRDWQALEKAFVAKMNRYKGTRPYEALVMMSGGKDSAYLASMLKNTYGLRILGFVMDINYEYPETFGNAGRLAEKLGLPYVMLRHDPEAMRRFFGFLFTDEGIRQSDGGQVCTFCGRFLIRSATEFAARMGIPLVFAGHNPDQIFLMGESIHSTEDQQIFVDFIMETLAEETEKALRTWRASYGEPESAFFPSDIKVDGVELVFPFQYFPYRPENMMREVSEKLDWRPIKRFSKTYIASGCRLVKLWAYMAWLNQTNSYVDFEFCSQVRNRTLAMETAQRFYREAEVDYHELAEVIRELDIVLPMRSYLTSYGEKASQLLREL